MKRFNRQYWFNFNLTTLADGLATELNCGRKGKSVGHSPLTEIQMLRSRLVTAMTELTELKNHKWTTSGLSCMTEGETTETEEGETTVSDLKVKVTGLSLGSTHTVTLQCY